MAVRGGGGGGGGRGKDALLAGGLVIRISCLCLQLSEAAYLKCQ